MGKKLLLIIIYVSILSVCHSNAQSMNDKWDENNKTYTNYTCGFYWNLHEDLLWTKQPLRQKDAVFGAVDIETRTVAYITATPIKASTNDIWSYESELRRGQKDAFKEITGAQIIETGKVIFAGKNALKTKVTYNLAQDDRFKNSDIKMLMVQYSILLQNYVVTFSVLATQDIENELNKYGLCIENVFFNGVVLTNPKQLK